MSFGLTVLYCIYSETSIKLILATGKNKLYIEVSLFYFITKYAWIKLSNTTMNRFQIYSSSLDLSLALGFVTLIASCWARSTMSLRFLLETLWAISAAKVRFCMSNTSNSCEKKFYKIILNQLQKYFSIISSSMTYAENNDLFIR